MDIHTHTHLHIYIYIYIYIKCTHKTKNLLKAYKMGKNPETHFYKEQFFATPYKTLCPPSYHHNGFVANHALGYMNRTLSAQVHELPQSRCGDNYEGTFFS